MGEEFGVPAIALGDCEFAEEPGDAVVLNGESFTAGFVSERAGEVGFAGAGGSGDDAVVALTNPLAGGQREHEGFVEAAPGSIVDVFAGDVQAQPCTAQAGVEPSVVAEGVFLVDDKSEAFVEDEFVIGGVLALFAIRAFHGGKEQFAEFFEGGVGQHEGRAPFFPFWIW